MAGGAARVVAPDVVCGRGSEAIVHGFSCAKCHTTPL
jgi:hypothetical protein